MSTNNNKKRIRDRGFVVGDLLPGERNSIADVGGVTVGHVTINEGEDVRTGVTVIDPGIKNIFHNKVPAAISVGNGFGKLVGITQVQELGTLETPIALTNTLAVGRVARGLVDLILQTSDVDPLSTVNAVVGETNDGFLNAIHKNFITEKHVLEAYENRSADFDIGSVGAGTGTRAFSWKGGIGTASRKITVGQNEYLLGVLIQTNYGGSLQVMGVPVGRLLGKSGDTAGPQLPDGSCMVILATDAGLTSRQLQRIAKRSFLGLARTGSVMAHGSGDYAIAFTTAQNNEELPDENLNQFFTACVEAVEESVYDALFTAKKVTGRGGNALEALPIEQVVELLKERMS